MIQAKLHSTLKKHISENWYLFRSEPNQYIKPDEFIISDQELSSAVVPGTVAMSVKGKSPECWSPDIDYDDFDWWYYCQFNGEDFLDSESKAESEPKAEPESEPKPEFEPDSIKLCFEGLATFCEVWLNGQLILTSDNMFRGFEALVAPLIAAENELCLVFRSTTDFLKAKRPRPQWKTKLVENQQMRWVRATVLGHVPVWTPPIKAVGPWKTIYIERQKDIQITEHHLTTSVDQSVATLNYSSTIFMQQTSVESEINEAFLKIDNKLHPISFSINGSSYLLSCQLRLPELSFWWPHTHGKPQLYDCEIILKTNTHQTKIDCGKLGFKSTNFIMDNQQSALIINQETIFCRGTCWTVSDYMSLNASRETLEKQLTMMCDAGINMIRVGGTMTYESDHFYQLCDELGLLVWQDFMFASMDYPVKDEGFANNVKAEISYQLKRLNQYACISVYCGNTDVEAQAAMYGMPKAIWHNELFTKWIPESCQELHPQIPYIESSPTGGAMPFHLNQGVTHFWANGAYMHPTNDNNKTRVKFASEGMGLSHIPEDETIFDWIGKSTLFPYDNDWQQRIPRDLGAGWDFDDIRDTYLKELFDVDPIRLRRQNVERYIELSRVVTGEVISRVFNYWRSYNSQCNGGLIWFNRDFWPCAGFGIIDSNDTPKAAYFQLKRVWQGQCILLENEGLDGASITVVNESPKQLEAQVEVELIKGANSLIAKTVQAVKVSSNDKIKLSVDEMLARFYDTGYAYKFGPPQFDVLTCRLVNSNSETNNETSSETISETISEAFLFSDTLSLPILENIEASANATITDEETICLTIESDSFLQFVSIHVKNYLPDDNYFHLTPGKNKTINLKRQDSDGKKFRGRIEATNLASSIKIKMNE